MKKRLTFICLLAAALARGQDSSYAGVYGVGDSVVAHILYYGKNLFIDLPHYGKLQLAKETEGRYTIQRVRPKVTLVFDSAGLTFYQKGDFTFLWDPGPADTSPQAPLGRYTQDIDVYAVRHITNPGGRLALDGDILIPVSKNVYRLPENAGETYEFLPAHRGRPPRMIMHTTAAPHTFARISGISGAYAVNEHASGQVFTRADTLLGMLTPLRTCYDALFYSVDVKIDPDTRSIQGNVLIRLRTIAPFDSLQLDLAQTMTIDSIQYRGRPLTYTREFGAVYVHFPQRMDSGRVEELRVLYHGKPRLPDLPTLKGGFFWSQDRDRHPLFESVCQGTGASLWWPCKDHNSDKPDSVRISITVPRGLTDISNGRFLDSVALPGNWTRWDWYVGYPINVYNVVANVGHYVHFGSTYLHGNDTIPLNFYALPYHLDKGRALAAQVPPMLDLYEQDFGPWPFPRDGYALVESIWPMEHQSAVGIGPFNHTDMNSLWHESAHEYWGNSVTCRDYADFWIHESFATYAEVLNLERQGPEKALKYLQDGVPANQRPIIGVYNVNNFHWGDMYTKGPWMLYTLQHCIANDSLWFSILRGIQQRYRYGTVTTEDIVSFVGQATGADYTPVFDQYLRHAAIPVLALRLKEEDGLLQVDYKWEVDVPDFRMRVKVTLAKDSLAFIYPTTNWQTIALKGMAPGDFRADTANFYVAVKVE